MMMIFIWDEMMIHFFFIIFFNLKKNIIIMIILYNKKITIELNSKKKGERKISGLYWIYKY